MTDVTAKLAEALPPLPEPVAFGYWNQNLGWYGCALQRGGSYTEPDRHNLYTADQMHAYAKAALAEVDEENAQLREQNTAVDVACARYEAEAEALRKDAERYRSLYWHWEDACDMAPGGRWWVSVHTCELGWMQGPDAAIDAAMKENKHE